jgi:hypothetical protein
MAVNLMTFNTAFKKWEEKQLPIRVEAELGPYVKLKCDFATLHDIITGAVLFPTMNLGLRQWKRRWWNEANNNRIIQMILSNKRRYLIGFVFHLLTLSIYVYIFLYETQFRLDLAKF